MAIRPLNIMSICAGIGCLDSAIGLAASGSHTVCIIERDSCAAATLVAWLEDSPMGAPPVWDDISTFDGIPWRGVVDCIAAGLPCQPYSITGARKGDDDERAIWPEFCRVVGEVRPSLVFLENVPNFVTGGHFCGAGEELSRLGYTIQDPLFLRAEDVGAPHRRERVFILAHGQGHGRSQGRPESAGIERGSDAAECGGAVAHAQSQPQREPDDAEYPESREHPRRDVGGSVCAVGDTWGERHERPGAGGPQKPAQASDGEVEHSDRQGLEGRSGQPAGQGKPGSAAERDSQALGVFPPGPGDFAAWDAILREHPELAPAIEPQIQQLVDGAPSRSDQLRLIGNGVVPLVAATAFSLLAEAAGYVKCHATYHLETP